MVFGLNAVAGECDGGGWPGCCAVDTGIVVAEAVVVAMMVMIRGRRI